MSINENKKKDPIPMVVPIFLSLMGLAFLGLFTWRDIQARNQLPHLTVGINDASVTVKVTDVDSLTLLPGFKNRGMGSGNDDFIGKMVLFSPNKIKGDGKVLLLEVNPRMTVPGVWVIENWDKQGGYNSRGANQWEWGNIFKAAQSDLDLTVFLTADYNEKTKQFSHVPYTCRTIKSTDGEWHNDLMGIQFDCAPDKQ